MRDPVRRQRDRNAQEKIAPPHLPKKSLVRFLLAY